MDNGELIVSQRDLQRMHVIQLTLEGRASVGRGAELLGLSARQVKRLRKKRRESLCCGTGVLIGGWERRVQSGHWLWPWMMPRGRCFMGCSAIRRMPRAISSA